MARFRDFPWVALVWLSERRKIGGLDVCVAAASTDAREVFSKVSTALDLIEQYDCVLMRQIVRDVRRLLFTESSGASYLSGIGTCRIDIAYTRRVSRTELAMTIIHEATHAHLDTAGMRYKGDQRETIERACVAAEIGFGEKVPDSERFIANARKLLETRWWERERIAADALRELRDRGLPAWLARWIARRAAK